MIRTWSPWETTLGSVCATQRSQTWWVIADDDDCQNWQIFSRSEPETQYFLDQNLRLKLSDIEDVVCASASRPEELAGQKVRGAFDHFFHRIGALHIPQPTRWSIPHPIPHSLTVLHPSEMAILVPYLQWWTYWWLMMKWSVPGGNPWPRPTLPSLSWRATERAFYAGYFKDEILHSKYLWKYFMINLIYLIYGRFPIKC